MPCGAVDVPIGQALQQSGLVLQPQQQTIEQREARRVVVAANPAREIDKGAWDVRRGLRGDKVVKAAGSREKIDVRVGVDPPDHAVVADARHCQRARGVAPALKRALVGQENRPRHKRLSWTAGARIRAARRAWSRTAVGRQSGVMTNGVI